MKRSQLKRSSKRREPAPERWLARNHGVCELCGRTGGFIANHHCVYAQHVRAHGGDVWDPANAMPLCEQCHAAHHQRIAVIPLGAVPPQAVEFAVDLLGAGAAGEYFGRYYRRDEWDEREAA